MRLVKKYKWRTIQGLCLVVCMVLTPYSKAQTPSVFTSSDKNSILIGEPVVLTVKAIFDGAHYNMTWFQLPDSIPHFEVLDRSGIDSSQSSGNTKVVEQKITITSWDSGKWNFPPNKILFGMLVDTVITLSTDPVPVTVDYAPADSTNQLRDIKPIIKVGLDDYTWYFIAAGVLILLIVGYLIRNYYRKKPKAEKPVFNAKVSPYDEAMSALAELEQPDITDPVQVKKYHSRLSEIFKRYISRKENRDVSGLTTSEILIDLKKMNVSNEFVSALASALRCGDAVKFAKYVPTMVESKDSLEKIKDVIQLLQ